MNVEQNRLDTFHEWPHDAPVGPARIAKAGFYSTHQGLEAQCFACQLVIAEWDYGDQVMAKHRGMAPECPFVTDPTTSGNVPIIPTTINTPRPVTTNHEQMKDESARLQSFGGWPIPHIVTPEGLAKAGFYYLHISDHTKCAFCKGVVRAWESGDDPDYEHQRHFSNCPFVLSDIAPRLVKSPNYKPPMPNIDLVANANNGDLHSLGVQAYKAPKSSSYATLESRLRSFASWPSDLIQTPDSLAQSGFYYEGQGDSVRCFHCDGGLRHWDPQDDPWTEHARWFPRCSFVQLVKGQDFVTACSLELNNVNNSHLEEVSDDKTATTTTASILKKREITDRELQQHLTSEVALSALSIGLNVERVKRAIREKLEQTGRGYSQPDALVEAALNLQHDEEEEEAEEVSQQVKHVVETVLENLVVQKNGGDDRREVDSLGLQKEPKNVSLEEENRRLKEACLCKICMDAEVGIVFLPCGHLTTCVNCAPNLEDCPVCRSAIKATVRTFLS